MQIRAEIQENGDLKLACFCLKTDSWLDFLAFKEDAKHALANGDIRAHCRFLRAALVCLFAHTEGVVNEINSKYKIPAVYRGNRLYDRIRNTTSEASKRVKVPSVNFRLEKHLRDLIAHPGIEIAFQAPGAVQEVLDQGAVYERLDLEALDRIESQISPWIDAVCSAFGVSRFEDTQNALAKFVQELSNYGFTPTPAEDETLKA